MFQKEQFIVERLAALVEAKRVPLRDLSESSGVPLATLSRKLRGVGDLTVSEFFRLARALNVRPADLLTDDDSANPQSKAGAA